MQLQILDHGEIRFMSVQSAPIPNLLDYIIKHICSLRISFPDRDQPQIAPRPRGICYYISVDPLEMALKVLYLWVGIYVNVSDSIM